MTAVGGETWAAAVKSNAVFSANQGSALRSDAGTGCTARPAAGLTLVQHHSSSSPLEPPGASRPDVFKPRTDFGCDLELLHLQSAHSDL